MKCQLAGALSQERVLLFTRRGEFERAKEQYLDGHYARPLSEIHKNYGITLGFLKRAEINAINAVVKCPKLDFALVGYRGGESRVYTFDKRSDPIRLDVLKTAADIKPYKELVIEIRKRVFDDKTGQLDVNHDFSLL